MPAEYIRPIYKHLDDLGQFARLSQEVIVLHMCFDHRTNLAYYSRFWSTLGALGLARLKILAN
jgi:hypothetical protein